MHEAAFFDIRAVRTRRAQPRFNARRIVVGLRNRVHARGLVDDEPVRLVVKNSGKQERFGVWVRGHSATLLDKA